MASKKRLWESQWRIQVQKEKCAAKEWQAKYGYLKDEILRVRKEVDAAIKSYTKVEERRVIVTLPDNEVPVPKQMSQMIGWRSTQQKLIYDKLMGDGYRRRKPLEEFMCFCRVGYDCICPGSEGLHSFQQNDNDSD